MHIFVLSKNINNVLQNDERLHMNIKRKHVINGTLDYTIGTAHHSRAPELCCSIFRLVFCKSLFVRLSFFFGHCIVCPSSIDGF